MHLIEQQLRFYTSHGLVNWADAIRGLSWAAPAPREDGFEPVAVLPPLELQRAETAQLLDAMTAPHPDLPPEQHYAGYWVQDVAALANSDIIGRPEGPYALWLKRGPFPEQTMGLTCTKLVKNLTAAGSSGLTAHEFLVVQRLKTLADGDHRWSAYYPADDHPPGHQWLPNSRLGKKVFQGYWVARSGQVQLAACATGSKKPSRGAHPCLVTPLST